MLARQEVYKSDLWSVRLFLLVDEILTRKFFVVVVVVNLGGDCLYVLTTLRFHIGSYI